MAPVAPDTRKQSGCLPLFGLLFALGGVALAIYTWQLPSRSHSDSDVVFRATMSAVITGIGIVLIVLGRLGGKAERTAGMLASRHPEKPWFWREDWEQGYAHPEATSQAATWLAIGALLLLIAAPLGLQLRDELLKRGNYAALLGLVFPVVGLLMVGKSGMAWLHRRKFANLRLVMSGVPAVLGGRLTGRIDGAFRLAAGTDVNLVLSCVRSYLSGSGTSRPRWQNVLWQDKRRVTALTGGPKTTSIPVDFEIPYDARSTDSRDPDDEILWRLSASADSPGMDFRCEFLIPVFQTAASDPRLTIAVLDARSQARNAGIKPTDSAIASGPSPAGGARFYLPAAGHKGIATAFTVFGLICLGSGLFFGYGLSQFSWVLGLIPVVVIGGLGLLLLAIAFGMWFGATTVEVVHRDLHADLVSPAVLPIPHFPQG